MADDTRIHQVNPYPGPSPFKEEDSDRFFGRNREVSEIASLLVAHRLVVLYAQSGAGKSSLINAGVIPRLKQKGIDVLPVARLKGLIPEDLPLSEVPNPYTFNAIRHLTGEDAAVDRLLETSLEKHLLEFAKREDEFGEAVLRVLIVDQFEELFESYPARWRDRSEFLSDLAAAQKSNPELRILLVLREEYLADLEGMAHLLPERARVRYRLELLSAAAARLAVEEPLKDTGRRFEADEGRNIDVARDLVSQLLTARIVTAEGEQDEIELAGVEPVQLQIVCWDMWRRLKDDVALITRHHLEKWADVDAALERFYEAAIRNTVARTEIKESDLRRWFGKELITPAKTRGTVFSGAEEAAGLDNRVVEILENDEYLVRSMYRAGGRWYELAHDRFIEPILRSNNRWWAGQLTSIRPRTSSSELEAPTSAHAWEEVVASARRQRTWLWGMAGSVVVLLVWGIGAEVRDRMSQQRSSRIQAETASRLAKAAEPLIARAYRSVSDSVTTGRVGKNGLILDSLIHLQSGEDYAVVAACGVRCDSLGLVLISPGGDSISVNGVADGSVTHEFSAERGSYGVELHVTGCPDPCFYALQKYSQTSASLLQVRLEFLADDYLRGQEIASFRRAGPPTVRLLGQGSGTKLPVNRDSLESAVGAVSASGARLRTTDSLVVERGRDYLLMAVCDRCSLLTIRAAPSDSTAVADAIAGIMPNSEQNRATTRFAAVESVELELEVSTTACSAHQCFVTFNVWSALSGEAAQESIDRQLDQSVGLLPDSVFTPIIDGSGESLASAAIANHPLTLESGRQYVVVAACDEYCLNLDLWLSQSGVTVAGDTLPDAYPVVEFEAPTDSLDLIVRVSTCVLATCRYGYRVYEFDPVIVRALRIIALQHQSFWDAMGRYVSAGEDIFYGSLEPGGRATHDLEIGGRGTYVLLGACGQDCSNIDLTLLADGVPVAADVWYDDTPVVGITEPGDRSLSIQVDMAECSSATCYYGLRTLAASSEIERRYPGAFTVED